MSVPVPPPRKKKGSAVPTPDEKFRHYAPETVDDRPHSKVNTRMREMVEEDGMFNDNPILSEHPESTIGPNVRIKGNLQYNRLLRIEGQFEGTLITQGGDLVVAKTGKVYGDIENLNQVVVEGKVVGNIFAERLQLRGFASVHGDITCKSVNIGPNVVLVGSLNIHPLAPKVIDSNGNIVVPSKKPLPEVPSETKKAAASKKETITESAITSDEPSEIDHDSARKIQKAYRKSGKVNQHKTVKTEEDLSASVGEWKVSGEVVQESSTESRPTPHIEAAVAGEGVEVPTVLPQSVEEPGISLEAFHVDSSDAVKSGEVDPFAQALEDNKEALDKVRALEEAVTAGGDEA